MRKRESVCVFVCVCALRDQEVCVIKRCVFESLDMKCLCMVLLCVSVSVSVSVCVCMCARV